MTPFWSIDTLRVRRSSFSAPSVVPNMTGGVRGGAAAEAST